MNFLDICVNVLDKVMTPVDRIFEYCLFYKSRKDGKRYTDVDKATDKEKRQQQ
jgi:hypothetical protein